MSLQNQYLKLLLSLLPPGQIDRSEGSNFAKVLTPAAAEFARIHKRAAALIDEADPRKTIELFNEWEAFTGLPDSCSLGDQTLGERRDSIISKLLDNASPSRQNFKNIAQRLGYQVEIYEYRPLALGQYGCGRAVTSDAHGQYLHGCQPPGVMHYHWNLRVSGAKFVRFACGRSACGDPLLKIRRADELECILRRIKPADSKLTFIYEE
tara:strand:- start:4737 stop:5363 length:627 start_codon:yes stop_codon:yes gene_type:complete